MVQFALKPLLPYPRHPCRSTAPLPPPLPLPPPPPTPPTLPPPQPVSTGWCCKNSYLFASGVSPFPESRLCNIIEGSPDLERFLQFQHNERAWRTLWQEAPQLLDVEKPPSSCVLQKCPPRGAWVFTSTGCCLFNTKSFQVYLTDSSFLSLRSNVEDYLDFFSFVKSSPNSKVNKPSHILNQA